MKRALALCLAVLMLVSILPAQEAQAMTNTAVVKGGWLRLRAAADFSAITLNSYFTGTVVTILGTSGAWYHVQTPDGLTGYMYGSYLTVGGTPISGTEATVTSANGLPVRMRTGPSTNYGVIAKYSVGTVVTVLSKGTYWSYISVNGYTGYMMSQFLSTGGVVPPTEGYLARVTSTNGYGVRLRSGAGKGYGILGVYSVGTEVTVLQHNSVWDYIRIGTRTGYMMNEFLTTGGIVTTISGVAISNTNPGVGDKLTASTLPAGATVTYKWKNSDGVTLSTSSVYTVQISDAGKRISVTVTGTGSYTGSATSAATAVVVARSELTGITVDNDQPYVGLTLTSTVSPASATVDYAWYRGDGTLVARTRSYTVQPADVGYQLRAVAVGTGDFGGTVKADMTDAVTQSKSKTKLKGTLTVPSLITRGETLYASWTNFNAADVDVTYTWYLNGAVVDGSTTSIVAPDVVGGKLKLRATANASSEYQGYVDSGECVIQSTTQALNGTIAVPTTVTAGTGITAQVNLNSSAVTYQWYLNGGTIDGETGVTLNTTGAMIGSVKLVATAVSGTGYNGTVSSAECSVTASTQALTGTVSLTFPSSVEAGQQLVGNVNGSNASGFTYQWYRDGGAISGATGSSYLLTADDLGKTIKLVVTATDTTYTGSIYTQTDLP